MNTELNDKIKKVIEDNLSKTECEVLSNVIKDYDRLKEKSKKDDEEIKEHEKELDSKRDRIRELEREGNKLREELDKSRKDLNTANEETIKLKKELIDVKLVEKEKYVAGMFDLVKTVFKTPAKVSEFTTPVAVGQYTSQYNNGGTEYQKSGEYVDTHFGRSKTDVE